MFVFPTLPVTQLAEVPLKFITLVSSFKVTDVAAK